MARLAAALVLVATATSTTVAHAGVGVVGPSAATASGSFAASCSAPTLTIVGPSSLSPYIAQNDVVLLASGLWTGGLDKLPTKAIICIAAGATFQPPFVNQAQGTIWNQGTIDFPSVSFSAQFTLENAGTVSFANGFNSNGSATFHNDVGGTITVGSPVSISGSADVINDGTWTFNGGLTTNGGTVLTNTGVLTVNGALIANGDVRNTGTTSVSGTFTTNSGVSVDNSCIVAVGADLMNNATFANSGLVTVTGKLTNNRNYSQASSGLVTGKDFGNDGTVRGFGSYLFSGATATQGTFAGDSASQPIVFDDLTPGAGIFDTQSGTVVNVVAGTVAPPGPGDVPTGCTNVTPTNADVEASKVVPAAATVGDVITATITVTNLGPADATAVTVVDASSPIGLLSAVTASNSGTVSGGSVTWTLPLLTAGTTVNLTITGTATAPGTLRDVVSATSTTPDPVESNNDGSAANANGTTQIAAAPPPPNRPPIVGDRTVTTVADTAVFGTIVAIELDAGQTVTFTRSAAPAHGTAVVDPGGAFLYQPAAGYTGRDSFQVSACDNGTPPLCATATVFVTVFPVARDDTATTVQGVPVDIAVLTNDDGTTGAPATAIPPRSGSVTAGTLMTYTPRGGFTGVDLFTYVICAPTDTTVCATAAVQVTVAPAPNDPPVVGDAAATTRAAVPVSGAVILADPNAGQTVTATLGSAPANGTAVVGATGTFTYDPGPSFTGIATFTVQGCDDGTPVLCSTGTVTVTVAPAPRPDIAVTALDTPITVAITANDVGNALPPTLVAGGGPLHGVASISGVNALYTPATGFVGTDIFHYQVCSPAAPTVCAVTYVVIEVAPPPNSPPVTEDQSAVTTANTAVGGTLTAVDPNPGQTVSFALTSAPSSGTATVSSSGAWTFQPAAGFVGRVTFTFSACDDAVTPLCATATVTVDVYPLARPDVAATVLGSPVLIDVLANDVGGVGAPAIVVAPATGTAVVQGTSLLFTPAQAGIEVLRYQVCGGTPSLCSTTKVAVATRPLVVDDTAITDAGTPVTILVSKNDLGGVGPTLVTPPMQGSAVVQGSDIVYTPAGSFTGYDDFTYQRCAVSPSSLCSTATVYVAVLPVAVADAATTEEAVAVTIDVAANDRGDAGLAIIKSSPAKGTVTVESDGQVTYTPTAGFTGTDVFTYQRCAISAPNLCAKATVVVKVTPASPPVTTVPDTLPATGTSTGPSSGLGAVLVLAGGLLVLITRRRRAAG